MPFESGDCKTWIRMTDDGGALRPHHFQAIEITSSYSNC